jgi:hypothetical protein
MPFTLMATVLNGKFSIDRKQKYQKQNQPINYLPTKSVLGIKHLTLVEEINIAELT